MDGLQERVVSWLVLVVVVPEECRAFTGEGLRDPGVLVADTLFLEVSTVLQKEFTTTIRIGTGIET